MKFIDQISRYIKENNFDLRNLTVVLPSERATKYLAQSLFTCYGKPFSEKNTDGSLSLIYREYGQGNSYIIDIVPNDSTLSFEQIATIYIASPPI